MRDRMRTAGSMMMDIVIRRMNQAARAALKAHFFALSMKDRHRRFCTALAPGAIAAYVDGIDFDHDSVFGVHDDRHVLVGAAHVAFERDLGEVGLSVLPAHRGRGIGGALFGRAAVHARSRGIRGLIMYYLSDNAPIMRIARRFCMKIAAEAGTVKAYLDLPPASLLSRRIAQPLTRRPAPGDSASPGIAPMHFTRTT